MSRENVEAVTRAIDAINERAIDRYLACCTEDIELRSPQSDVEGRPYVGEPGIRRWFADIADGKIRRVQIYLDRQEALEAVGLTV